MKVAKKAMSDAGLVNRFCKDREFEDRYRTAMEKNFAGERNRPPVPSIPLFRERRHHHDMQNVSELRRHLFPVSGDSYEVDGCRGRGSRSKR